MNATDWDGKEQLTRETAVLMFADVVESVRLIEQNEALAVGRIRAVLRSASSICTARYSALLLEQRGDGILVKFAAARDAAACALELHAAVDKSNVGIDSLQRIALRIGIHKDSILADDDRVYGQGINLAARVTALAGPFETVMSAGVRDELIAGFDCEIEDLGDCYLKHVPEPLRAFRLAKKLPFEEVPAQASYLQDTLPTIAVLPFSTGQSSQELTASDLLAETLAHYLSRAGSLKVIAWQSTKAFRNTTASTSELTKALVADWIICGSCHLSGSSSNQRILVNAQLVFAKGSAVVHSERITNSLSDLLESESELAATLAKQIVQSVTDSEANRVSTHALPTLSSHSLLIGAASLMHRSNAGDFTRSKDALEHLLERQPRMHSARPWLAKWYVLRATKGFVNGSPDEANRALSETSRALDSNGCDAFALAIQGFVYFHLLKNRSLALDCLEQAVSINQNEPLAAIFKAALISSAGQSSGGWPLAQHALSLSPFDPLRPYMRMIAASCALYSQEFEQALLLAKQSIFENTSHLVAWRVYVIALVYCNQIQEARKACAQLLSKEPSLTLESYAKKLTLPDEAKRQALYALQVAGVPKQ